MLKLHLDSSGRLSCARGSCACPFSSKTMRLPDADAFEILSFFRFCFFGSPAKQGISSEPQGCYWFSDDLRGCTLELLSRIGAHSGVSDS